MDHMLLTLRSALVLITLQSDLVLHRVLHTYVKYFNEERPYQGICQQVPQGEETSGASEQHGDRIITVPILGGLHHVYRRAA